MALVVCLLLGGIVAFVVFATINSRSSTTCNCPAGGVWTYQYNQASLQHSHDEFALKDQFVAIAGSGNLQP